nr:ribonuclease H-like domain-containing protein [Tanacetum cinerariifolium]
MMNEDKEEEEDALIGILTTVVEQCKSIYKKSRIRTPSSKISKIQGIYAMADVGAGINMMPKSLFEHLKFANRKKTSMTIKMVIDTLEEPDETILLGRPFLATIHDQIDVFRGEILLGVGNEKVMFDMNGEICHSRVPLEKMYMVCKEDCGIWPTCNLDLSICSGYDAIYGKEEIRMLKQRICFRDHERQNVEGNGIKFDDFLKGGRDMLWKKYGKNVKIFIIQPNSGNPQIDLQDHGVIDSRCSRHMIWNMSYLIEYEEIDGGYVAFGRNPKGEKITGKDHLGKFDGKADEGFFVRYSLNSKTFRVFNSRTRIVEENLHIRFSESTTIVVGSGPYWLFDIDALTRKMNYEPIVAVPKSSNDDGSKPSSDDGKKVDEDPRKESEYGKEIVITESSVRRDLQLANEEGSTMPTDPHHTPTILQPSSSQPQKTQKPRKPKRKDTQLPQPSGPPESFIDEVVHKELGDSLTKTTQKEEISSLERRVTKLEKRNRSRTHKLKRLYKVSLSARVESYGDEESLGVDASKQERRIDAYKDITLVNDADNEIFDVDTLVGEEVFVARQNENVVKEVVDVAQVNTAATTVTITTEEITLDQVLEALKTSKPKVKMIVFQEPEEPVKPKKKDQIRIDEEAAKKLQAEFDEEERVAREKDKKEERANIALIKTWDDIQEKINKRRKHFAAKRAQEKRNKPPTKAQQRKIMCTHLKNMEGYKLKDLKLKEFDRIQEMLNKAFKRVNTFKDFKTELVEGKEKRAGTELEQEITKKQKVEDDK